MHSFTAAFVVLAGVAQAHFKTAQPLLGGCIGLACGAAVAVPVPQVVTIPDVNPFQVVTATAPKPVYHKHGLIPVKLPPAILPVAPATFAASVPAISPRMGKMIEKTQPTYFCKRPGFVLEGTMCVQSDVRTAEFVCPEGFQTGPHDNCERRTQLLQTCPAGFSRRDGQCARVVTAQFVSRCPDGTRPTETGGCEREVSFQLTPTCPEGFYEALTGNCVTTLHVEARAYCPENFNYVDGTCTQEEVYDCTNHLPLQTAPLLAAPSLPLAIQAPHKGLKVHHAHKRQLHAKKDVPLTVQAVPVVAAPPLIAAPTVIAAPPLIAAPTVVAAPVVAQVHDCNVPCTLGVVTCLQQRPVPCEAPPPPRVVMQPTKTTVSVQKTCTRVTSTALIFACDEGLLHGHQCLVKRNVPPTPVCNARGDNSYCFTLQRVAPIQECPSEYTRECLPGRACECVALEPAVFMQSCPAGFDQFPDGCVRTASASPRCPPGYNLEGGQCVRFLREPADCVFSVTYECDHTQGLECNPPAAQPLPF